MKNFKLTHLFKAWTKYKTNRTYIFRCL